MQELRVCVYDAGLEDRVGCVAQDRVYDLNLCCVQQLALEKGTLNAYRLANNLVHPELGAFLKGGSNTLSAARQALDWVLNADSREGPAGEPLYHSANDVKLKAPILPSTKVCCMGGTFISHMVIAQREPHDFPVPFYKMSQVVVGPEEWVVIPKHHPEPVIGGTELTVVIGKRGRSIPETQTEAYIWG